MAGCGCCSTTGCPCLTFDSVEFCCATDGSTSVKFRDTGGNLLNNKPFCQAATFGPAPTLCPICTNDDNCDGAIDAGSMIIEGDGYATADCTGASFPFTDVLYFYLANISGTWHILCLNPFFTFVFFYGTTPAFGTPASNTLTCSSGTTLIDNALTDCAFGGPFSAYVCGFNGTANLTSACPIGACCITGVCFDDYYESPCIALGGTYQGDGTDCGTITC